jgi:hypothetical protein
LFVVCRLALIAFRTATDETVVVERMRVVELYVRAPSAAV